MANKRSAVNNSSRTRQSERETRAYRIFAVLHKSRLALPFSRRILDELLTADEYTVGLFRRACWLPARTIGWSATAVSGRSWGSSPSTSAGSSSLKTKAKDKGGDRVSRITPHPKKWFFDIRLFFLTFPGDEDPRLSSIRILPVTTDIRNHFHHKQI